MKKISFLWLEIALYTAILSFLSWYKYDHYLYNGLDLAIYQQVFWNTLHGNFFDFSIHPGLFLGDHFTPIILFFVPIFFALGSHSVSLLVIQSFALAVAAWPLYHIAKIYVSEKQSKIVSVIWLLFPLLHNINLFEFHEYAFAPVLLLSAYYFYQKNRFSLFSLFAILSMMVREDIALIIFMFSVLSFLDKKKFKWILFPFVSAIIYFLGSTSIIRFFAESESYKFLIYYQWLGQTPGEILTTLITQPWVPLFHILSLESLLFLFLLFACFLFLPLRSPKILLLVLPLFLQHLLKGSINGEIILTTHYVTPFLVFLFVASVEGYKNILSSHDTLAVFIKKHREIFVLITLSSLVYFAFTLGPWAGIFESYSIRKQVFDSVLEPKSEAVAVNSSMSAQVYYASRKELYSQHYGFLGRTQFSQNDYSFPQTPNYQIIDFDEYLYYEYEFRKNPLTQKYWNTTTNNHWKNLDPNKYSLDRCLNTVCSFSSGGSFDTKYFYQRISFSSEENIDMRIASQEIKNNILEIRLDVAQKEADEKIWYIEIDYQNDKNVSQERFTIPVNYGFLNTNNWEKGESYQNILRLLLPQAGQKISLSLVSGEAYLGIGKLRETKTFYTKIEKIKEEQVYP